MTDVDDDLRFLGFVSWRVVRASDAEGLYQAFIHAGRHYDPWADRPAGERPEASPHLATWGMHVITSRLREIAGSRSADDHAITIEAVASLLDERTFHLAASPADEWRELFAEMVAALRPFATDFVRAVGAFRLSGKADEPPGDGGPKPAIWPESVVSQLRQNQRILAELMNESPIGEVAIDELAKLCDFDTPDDNANSLIRRFNEKMARIGESRRVHRHNGMIRQKKSETT